MSVFNSGEHMKTLMKYMSKQKRNSNAGSGV